MRIRCFYWKHSSKPSRIHLSDADLELGGVLYDAGTIGQRPRLSVSFLVPVPKLPSLDGPMRANRFADSRGSLDFRESPEGSQTEPLFLRIAFWGTEKLRIAGLRFARIARTL